jgi:2-oxoglutarate ferredoxin oxidoreductase subunit alpha
LPDEIKSCHTGFNIIAHMNEFITWKLGGEAGFGIMTSGLIYAKTLARAGLNVFDNIEYPSLVRGGHNSYQVTASANTLFAHHPSVDILVALNQQTIDLHIDELNKHAVIIYDGDQQKLDPAKYAATLLSVPFNRLAREIGQDPLMRNTVALGASMALLGIDFALLESVLKDMFGKHEGVAEHNIAAAQAAFQLVHEQMAPTHPLPTLHKPAQAVMSGNEAIGFGAIAAGMKLYSAYPMTPASSLMHFLAATQDKFSFVMKHVEDELSAINMAIGGSVAGVRTMTGSSGGGFALMVEAYTLAAITETPLVIVEVMRPGPATGLPTWTGQEDLQFVLHAGHGEFPRVVIAPGDTEECFALTQEAFNIADQYQLPVIILSDLNLAENHQTTPDLEMRVVPIDRGLLMNDQEAAMAVEYRRYAITKSGISPRKIPGQAGGVFISNSDEHDEYGFSAEEALNRRNMVHKRARKIKDLLKKVLPIKLHGPKEADVTIVCFGSTKRPAIESLALLKADGIIANVLQIVYMAPFPKDEVLEIIRGAKHLLLVEANANGQLGSLIHEYTKVELPHRFLKYDGRVIQPEEIAAAVKKEFTHGSHAQK